ncbi:hypothetical protein Nepgr_029632 [Nepenthes gracilis]|uniref:Uncharacterized protein n=1 Tax=Nepenthes gracilis TaxID=150966 RepID=A0AAD3TEN4_NEPGR|nr:hypothetical protein Nepgr_029632 [Nepenthes gracilis]
MDEASAWLMPLRKVDRGSISNSSKIESVTGVPFQDVYVREQLEGSLGEAHLAEASSNYGIDDSTPGSIMRLTRKYCLVDVPNKISSRDLQVEGLLNVDQAAIQKDLNSAPMFDCMAMEDNASEDVPMQCSAHNPTQSQVESVVAEVDTDPLSLGITMLIKDNNFRLSLNALTPAADFSWFPTYSLSMKMQFVDENSEAYELTAALMVAGRMVSGPKIPGFLEVLFCCQAGIGDGYVDWRA